MLVIARAERDYLSRHPGGDVAESCIHEQLVFLRNKSGRVVARYGFAVTPNRIKVWRHEEATRTSGDPAQPPQEATGDPGREPHLRASDLPL